MHMLRLSRDLYIPVNNVDFIRVQNQDLAEGVKAAVAVCTRTGLTFLVEPDQDEPDEYATLSRVIWDIEHCEMGSNAP